MTAFLSQTRRASRCVAVLPLAAALFLAPAWGGDAAPARRAPAAELATASVTSEGGAGRSAYDGVVEAVRQTVIAAQVPGAVRRAERQGRRPHPGRPGAGCAWTRGPPNRRPPPAPRRCAPPAPPGRRHPRLRTPAPALREELHQPGRARPRRGAVQVGPGRSRGPAGQRGGRAHPVRLLRGQGALRRRGGRRGRGAGRHGDAGPSAADAVRPGRAARQRPRCRRSVAARLAPGTQPARSSCPARRDASAAAARQLLPTVDPATHTLELRLDLPAGLAGATPGMFARAWLPVRGRGRAPVRAAPAPCCAAPS